MPAALFRFVTEATMARYAYTGGAYPQVLAMAVGWLINEFLAACALYAELVYPSGAAPTTQIRSINRSSSDPSSSSAEAGRD